VDLDDTPEQAAYRVQVRTWLDEHKREAPILQGPGAIEDEDEIIAARRVWQGKLAEGGLAGVTWPKEYGGQGLGPIEQVICNQEIGRAGVPGILDAIGVGMLGPTIIAHGSEDQKSRYLAATTAAGVCPARRSGPPTPNSRPTACCSPAPTPTCPSTRG
jgi:alkylation response protein AidB-like acyl-CoA dehydrogenase